MLPVTTGFIFPDGSHISTGTEGHCKSAYKYIQKHNLQKQFNSYVGSADDFLIERLGAMKICHYRFKNYVYMPRNCGWYIKKIRNMYEKEGVIIKDCYMQEIKIDLDEQILITQGYSYNQTVIKTLTPDGRIIYAYNPARNGD